MTQGENRLLDRARARISVLRWLRDTEHGTAGPSIARRRAARRAARAELRLGPSPAGPHPASTFLRAHLGWITLVTLAVIGSAAMLSWSKTATYKSEAAVLVQPRLFSQGTAPQIPDMGTEKAVASSGVVLEMASRPLGISAEQLSHGLSVAVPLNTHILQIGYSAADPAQAQLRAQAVADAYVSYWIEQQPAAPKAAPKASSSAITTPATSVITTAKRAANPASPNHGLDVGIAVVVGLSLGIGSALIRDKFDDGLRGPGDFEAHAGAPVLALIPGVRQRKGDFPGRLVMVRAPDSLAAQAYRDLRTRIMRAASRRGAKTLLVTSPASQEQTTVAANLAAALAQSGLRVVLVCADLRWPLGHELFGVKNGIGLDAVLNASADLADVLCDTDIPGLQVLPAGAAGTDHGVFLHAPATRWVVGSLRGTADFVVIDAPPVLVGADTGSLVELADAVLVVADASHTRRAEVQAATRQLEHARSKLIGCVLTNVGRRTRLPKPPPLSLVSTQASASDTPAQPASDGPAGWAVPQVGNNEAVPG